MADKTKTKAGERNSSLTYAYTDITRAPSWHLAVAQYAAGGMTARDIAAIVGFNVDTVRKVLEHEPIQAHIRAMQERLQLEEQRFHHTIRTIIDQGLSRLLDDVENNAITPSECLRILEFAADRLPDSSLAKK